MAKEVASGMQRQISVSVHSKFFSTNGIDMKKDKPTGGRIALDITIH